MRECYHNECDKYNATIATDEKYDFMKSIVQSLVLTVAEMAMDNIEAENSKCVADTLEYLAEKKEEAESDASKKEKDEQMANKSSTNNNFNVKPMIAEKLNEIPNENTFKQDKHTEELQNMQKQLLEMFSMKIKHQTQDKEAYIGTQININNMNIDMTTKQAQ